MDEYHQTAFYYLRHKYYKHAQSICELGLMKSLADPFLMFLRALAIAAGTIILLLYFLITNIHELTCAMN